MNTGGRRRTLVVVPCGEPKIWDRKPEAGPTPAKDAYVGTAFKVNRQYAERVGDAWVVLSAKYGLLSPEDTVQGPYDVTFNRRGSDHIEPAAIRDEGSVRWLGFPPRLPFWRNTPRRGAQGDEVGC